jgi:ACDE family multidrug resistance protein
VRAAPDPLAIRRFLAGFISLSLLSGITIGMNKVLGTLLGVHLGVSHWQLGVIGGAETFAMAVGTLPAGWLLSRGNPKILYAIVSLALTVLFFVLPHIPSWQFVALTMFIVGLCISMRVVAVSTVFMVRLPELGQNRAGWYKGTLTLGMQFLGPLIGNELIARLGLTWGFATSGLMFVVLALLGWSVLPTSTGGANKPKTIVGSATPARLPGSLRELLRMPDVRRTYQFEILGSMTSSSYATFAILIAVEVLHWPLHLGVWLIAAQGIAYVSVLLGAGRLLLQRERVPLYYQLGHVLIVVGLLLLGTTHVASAFVLASVCFGVGLGLNNLINFSRLSQAPVDKARASAQLTLFGMLGGTFGAVSAGLLSRWFGLQGVYLLWIVPWVLLWPGWPRLPALLTQRAQAPIERPVKAGES